MGVEDTMKQVFVKTVFYRGSMVAMKPITAEGINLNRALMLELKQMKDLHHDHLTRFVGACLEPGDGRGKEEEKSQSYSSDVSRLLLYDNRVLSPGLTAGYPRGWRLRA
jgi:hypothetical protein